MPPEESTSGEPADADSAIFGNIVTGIVDSSKSDVFHFDGELKEFHAEEGVTIIYEGQEYTPEELQEQLPDCEIVVKSVSSGSTSDTETTPDNTTSDQSLTGMPYEGMNENYSSPPSGSPDITVSDDTGSKSQQNQRLQNAINNLQDGEYLKIEGDYILEENLNVSNKNNITIHLDGSIELRAGNKAGEQGANEHKKIFWFNQVDGMEFYGGRLSASDEYNEFDGLPGTQHVAGLRYVTNSEFHGTYYDGTIDTFMTGTDNQKLEIHHNVFDTSHERALYFNADMDFEVHHNEFLQIARGSFRARNSAIENKEWPKNVYFHHNFHDMGGKDKRADGSGANGLDQVYFIEAGSNLTFENERAINIEGNVAPFFLVNYGNNLENKNIEIRNSEYSGTENTDLPLLMVEENPNPQEFTIENIKLDNIKPEAHVIGGGLGDVLEVLSLEELTGQESVNTDADLSSSTTTTTSSSSSGGNYLFISGGELDSIQSKIDAGEDPWKSAYDSMMNTAESNVSKGNISYEDSRASAEEARDTIVPLALAYRFTGEDRFAESAIDKIHHFFINDSTNFDAENPVIPHARIINSITIPGLLFAASVVRDHSYWNTKIGDSMQNWCETHYQTSLDYSRQKWGSERKPYEWAANRFEFRVATRMAMAAFLGDDQKFDNSVQLFKDLYNAKLAFPDKHYNIPVDAEGHHVDRNRDSGWEYSRYALDAMVSIAEMARHKGYNLYEWQDNPDDADIKLDSQKGERTEPLIKRCMKVHNQYFNDPSSFDGNLQEGVTPPTVEPTARGLIAYEYTNSYYGDSSLGQEIESILNQYFETPGKNRKNEQYITLIHGNLHQL